MCRTSYIHQGFLLLKVGARSIIHNFGRSWRNYLERVVDHGIANMESVVVKRELGVLLTKLE